MSSKDKGPLVRSEPAINYSTRCEELQVLADHSPLVALEAGIMTRRLGAELEPEMTAVLKRPAAESFPRAPSPSILR